MPLDPEIEIVLDLIEKAGHPEFADLTPVEARVLFEETMPVLDAEWEPVAKVEDHKVELNSGAIPLRIYTPVGSETPLPVVVFYHGGGFVIGGLDSYDKICRVLVNRSGAIMVSVDYRLAPEHPFPAAVDDAVGALEWVAKRSGDFGGDGNRIAVAGDSAGGNLAAVAAQAARERSISLMAQILVYPTLGGSLDTASHLAFGEGYLLTRRNIDWFYDHYMPDDADPMDTRFAPLLADDLAGLAPALIIVAGHDPLRDEATDYANRLIGAGNDVCLSNYAGMIHGFLSLSGAVAEGRQAIAQIAATLRHRLGMD